MTRRGEKKKEKKKKKRKGESEAREHMVDEATQLAVRQGRKGEYRSKGSYALPFDDGWCLSRGRENGQCFV